MCRTRQCRWWPLNGPEAVSDGPSLACCLVCNDVRSLKAVCG